MDPNHFHPFLQIATANRQMRNLIGFLQLRHEKNNNKKLVINMMRLLQKKIMSMSAAAVIEKIYRLAVNNKLSLYVIESFLYFSCGYRFNECTKMKLQT